MKRAMQSCLMLAVLALPQAARGQSPVTGTWVTHNFGGVPNMIDLQANGATVTGTISRNNEVTPIYAGTISGNVVTFKANAGSAPARIITYTGRVNGDVVSFSRSVQVLSPSGDGAGIYGSRGPMEFAAIRDNDLARSATRLLLGDWRLSLERSTFNPVVATKPAAESLSLASRADGSLAFTDAWIGMDGSPSVAVALLKADGRDHPIHNANTIATLLTDGTTPAATLSLVAVSDRAFDVVSKNGGAVTGSRRWTLSPDGSTLTEAYTGMNVQGEVAGTATLVYERSQPTRPPTN
jgi:hypothetical protein